VTADAFWEQIDRRRERQAEQAEKDRAAATEARPRNSGVGSLQEVTFWLKEFGELDDLPETREVSRPRETLITDDDIAAIEREIDAELAGRTRRR
jgi:hypothetical protein